MNPSRVEKGNSRFSGSLSRMIMPGDLVDCSGSFPNARATGSAVAPAINARLLNRVLPINASSRDSLNTVRDATANATVSLANQQGAPLVWGRLEVQRSPHGTVAEEPRLLGALSRGCVPYGGLQL